jgi:ADP-ribose pyrophosphatase YjhB (NUDIX family)
LLYNGRFTQAIENSCSAMESVFMTTVVSVTPAILALFLPLLIANLIYRGYSRKAGVARGRSGRVNRAAICLAIGVLSTLIVLWLLLMTQDGLATFNRAITLRPYATMSVVAVAAALYAVASYRIWRHYNPVPVMTILFPVGEGLLVIRRATPPAVGQLAFPGGYIDEGESWQAAAVRELHEETGIVVHPDNVEIFSVTSSRRGHLLILYVLVKQPEPHFVPIPVLSPEVSELRILMRPIEFVWKQDTEAAQLYFANKPSQHWNKHGPDTVEYPPRTEDNSGPSKGTN